MSQVVGRSRAATKTAASVCRITPLAILVGDPDPDARAFYRQILPACGHLAPSVAETDRQLLDLFRSAPSDLVILDTQLPDTDSLELASAIYRERPVPIVLTSASPNAEAVWETAECAVLGFAPKPLRPESLALAIAVAVRGFRRLRALEDEAEQLRETLQERKVIERAKGAVMRYAGMSEEDAYRRLQRLATDRGQKLIDVAQSVLAASEVFGQLAGTDGTPRPSGDGQAKSRAPRPA